MSVPVVHDFVESIGMGDTHSLFLAHPGDVFVTGTNRFGELGDGNPETKTTPTELLRLNFTETTRTATTTITTEESTTAVGTTEESTTVTREGEGNETNPWPMYIGAIVVAVAVVALAAGLACQPNSEEAIGDDEQDTRPIELIRAELMNNDANTDV